VTGFPLSYLMTSIDYLYHFANPQYIPSQSGLDSLYMTNRISDRQWECYTKAHGNIPTLHRELRDSSTVRPINSELIQLYRRGSITSADQLWRRMRENGVTNPDHAQELYSLSEWMPQPPDLLRFMVRDVWDQKTVDRLGLDDEFPVKWTADASRLGKAVGLTDDVAKLEWRAHWRVPSDTALYTMVHRLRENRPETAAWFASSLEIGEKATIDKLGPEPPVFTVKDLAATLQINDNLPKMIPALTAISYRPITNTDAARMFEIGYFDGDQLVEAFQDNGYTRKDARTLTEFYRQQKAKRLNQVGGVWTPRKVVKQYKLGTLDRDTAEKLLFDAVPRPEDRIQLLDGAELELGAETLAKQIGSYKRRFLLGEFNEGELFDVLAELGQQPFQITKMLEQWTAERESRAKEPRVSMLCQWRDAGMISVEQHFERLKRIGYSDDDATRISQLCEVGNTLRRQKAAVAAAEKQRREAERLLRRQKEDLEGKIRALKEQLALVTSEAQAAGILPS